MSLRRQNRWMMQNLSAQGLFWAGVITLPAFLLQDSLLIRSLQVVVLAVLAVLAGKRLYWLYFLTITATITLFHVIVPSGQVLVEIGRFPVTLGALRSGLFKALTILGMVFISLVAVRADLRLPGSLGAVAGKIFWSFERIMERRGTAGEPAASAGGHGLVARADSVLNDLYDELLVMDSSVADTRSRKQTATGSSAAGRLVLLVVAAAFWLALLLG